MVTKFLPEHLPDHLDFLLLVQPFQPQFLEEFLELAEEGFAFFSSLIQTSVWKETSSYLKVSGFTLPVSISFCPAWGFFAPTLTLLSRRSTRQMLHTKYLMPLSLLGILALCLSSVGADEYPQRLRSNTVPSWAKEHRPRQRRSLQDLEQDVFEELLTLHENRLMDALRVLQVTLKVHRLL
jgi:hypothetical protein